MPAPVRLLVLVALAGCRGTPAPSTPAPIFPTRTQVVAEALARVDTDRDGVLSLEEYERVGNGRDTFRDLDFDGDRHIDVVELERALYTADPGYRNPVLPPLPNPPPRGRPW